MKIFSENYRGFQIKVIIGVMLCSAFLIFSCGSSNTAADAEGYKELQELVSSRDFEIENDWAFPNSGSNINLIGNPNYIKFKNDSVDIFLPYFGVRYSGGNYGGTDGGIIYKGPMENFEIKENQQKKSIDLQFEGDQNGENLDFNLNLYSNKKVRTTVISTERAPISYEGEINKKD